MPRGYAFCVSLPAETESCVRLRLLAPDENPVNTPIQLAHSLGLNEDDLPHDVYDTGILPHPVSRLLGYRYDSIRIDVPHKLARQRRRRPYSQGSAAYEEGLTRVG
jgi:hypothetical protein